MYFTGVKHPVETHILVETPYYNVSNHHERHKMNLKDYIHGKRHGKEANRLEREAMNDPFLQDAIDGFDSVAGDHFSAVESLEKRLAPQPKRIDKRVWMWAAAAVLVLLIGIPFLLRKPDLQEIQVASSETVKQEEPTVLLPQKDSVLVADNIESKPKSKQEKSVVSAAEEIAVVKPEEHEASIAPQMEKEAIAAEETQLAQVESNTKLVSGRLLDAHGKPIIGASVNIKENKQIGTITDLDGKFRLTVPKEQEGTLLAAYVGMENKEIPLKENVGDITLKDNAELLSEVVVVGYGTQRKNTMTGAVSKVKTNAPRFGEAEFKRFFEENYDKNLCPHKPILATVEFYVNNLGQPGNIAIKENSCPELDIEIKRLLLGSPPWSERNRKVTLKINIDE